MRSGGKGGASPHVPGRLAGARAPAPTLLRELEGVQLRMRFERTCPPLRNRLDSAAGFRNVSEHKVNKWGASLMSDPRPGRSAAGLARLRQMIAAMERGAPPPPDPAALWDRAGPAALQPGPDSVFAAMPKGRNFQ